MTTKDLYSLFPRAPARTAARIAGLPRPAGCI
jgi:tRNA 2-thiouridine synthesizing protein E